MKLGILGGGQLALMLAQAARKFKRQTCVLTAHIDDPATHAADRVEIGDPNHSADLKKFKDSVEFSAIENEFLDVTTLEQSGLKIFPPLAVIAQTQDKLWQKNWLKQNGIPTPPFVEVTGQSWKTLFETFPNGFVLKWARMGYDGKGVLKVASTSEEQSVSNFFENAALAGSKVYAEEFIRFEKELAMIGCYSVKQEFVSYPLVISEQKKGVCFKVFGPATEFGVPHFVEEDAKMILEKVARELNLLGCFAVEFFYTTDGKLLVNELAPRVHNSGHFSQDACAFSQFDNHWLALLGYTLGTTKAHSLFVMQNLLGPENVSGNAEEFDFEVKDANFFYHWYFKKTAKTGRKLGHINAVCKHKKDFGTLDEKLNAWRLRWEEALLVHVSAEEKNK